MNNKTLVGSALALLPVGAFAAASITGPSSSRDPYMVPVDGSVSTVSLISGGDFAGGNERLPSLAGIADGAGVIDNGDGTASFYVHHELSNGDGAVRAHGGLGSFIAEWVVNKTTLEVLDGEDAVKKIYLYDPSLNGFQLAQKEALNRLCSADLASPGAFAYAGLGTQERIFLGGEENDAFFGGAYGRAFATVLSGEDRGSMYQLPYLGAFAWENCVASPYSQPLTVVAGLDDSASADVSTLGELYFYVGRKSASGNDVERAGLQNGTLYAVAVAGWEELINGASGSIEPLSLSVGDSFDFNLVVPLSKSQVLADDGTALFEATDFGNPSGVTKFARPEDGAWDPTDENVFYFVTTGRLGRPGRLWKVEFDDIRKPWRGGTITLALDGTNSSADLASVYTADNICVDRNGDVFIQEDPGSSSRLCRVWRYRPSDGSLTAIAEANATYFSGNYNGANAPLITTNEESSGIIDVSDVFGEGWYFMSMQSHIDLENPANLSRFGYTTAEGLRYDEDSQLILMHVPAE